MDSSKKSADLFPLRSNTSKIETVTDHEREKNENRIAKRLKTQIKSDKTE